jgi:PPM family protein phosphatase
MKFSTATLSEHGPRPENEDSVGIWPLGVDRIAVAIADGLGGHIGGKIASQMAVEMFADFAKRESNLGLHNVAQQIHMKIRAEQSANPQYRTMATTLSAGILSADLMEFVHCGDSRIVAARNGGIKRLTVDQSEAQRLFDSGKLTREQLESYPRKNILESALGIQGEPKIDTGSFSILPGDRLFFTTDGLHNKIKIRELLFLTQECANAGEAITRLLLEMETRDAEDNYSCACVFVNP